MDLKSKKAIYVRSKAPAFCHIEFICKGNLICIRLITACCLADLFRYLDILKCMCLPITTLIVFIPKENVFTYLLLPRKSFA